MLELTNISKSFAQSAKPVLKNIDLQIKNGDYCIILGSNGSGKSTLLKIISGEYCATNGQIYLNNQNISSQSIHQRSENIASVAQDVTKGTIQDLTLMENIVLSNMRIRNATLKFYNSQKDEIYKLVQSLNLGLENFLDHKMSDLSGGQRQAIATLMATNPKPKLLLLDEHTSALDPNSHQKIMHFTDHKIKQHQITSLMITHNIKDAINYGNRLLIMSHGKVIHDFNQQQKLELSEDNILNIMHEADKSYD